MESTPARTAIDGTSRAMVCTATLASCSLAAATASPNAASSKLATGPKPFLGQSPISLTQPAPSLAATAAASPTSPGATLRQTPPRNHASTARTTPAASISGRSTPGLRR